jgi:hypothetical protein
MSSKDADLYRSAMDEDELINLPWSGGVQSPHDSLSEAN